MPRPYKASPSGLRPQAADEGKVHLNARQRVIAGNPPLIPPAATFPKGEGFITAVHPSGSYIPSRLTNFCSISSL